MIGKLKGIVDYIDKDHSIIDVSGVGYVVFCSSKTLQSFNMGEATSLIIETHVREDHIHLYGFLKYDERDWFRQLITVKGVGAKVALAILGLLTSDKLSLALAVKDKLAFTQISGIGPKLAERIITELKDKIVASSHDMINLEQGSVSKQQSVIPDAVSALVNLGYDKFKAYNAANRIFVENSDLSVGELIKNSLKELK